MGESITKGPGLKQLVEASKRITSFLSMEEVLGQVVGFLTGELGAIYAVAWIVERGDFCHECSSRGECVERDECLHLMAWDGPRDPSRAVKARVPAGVMKVGEIAKSLAPYITDDILADPMLADPAWVKEQGVKSFAAFPLVHDDRLLGLLAYYGVGPLSPETGDILSCFAHHSATAVEDSRQHERIRQSEERYKALIDGAIDAVFILGTDGGILNASLSACALFGYAKEEMAGMNIRDFDMADNVKLSAFLDEASTGKAITYETTFSTKSGDHFPSEVRAGRINYGDAAAVQAFVRDMTERKKLERQKAELISMVTHDLKGPLSIILGYAEVISGQYADDLPEFVREGVGSIHGSAKKLLSMIEDYLSLSKLEAGMMPMEKSETALPPILNRAMDTVLFKAEEKKLTVRLDCPASLPKVKADPKYLERAVTNLMLNAVNYTPRGGSVTLSCRTDTLKNTLDITVTDTGVGIHADELPKIFDAYYRSGKDPTKGSGLGLAIVKSVVESHGGTVSVESEVGHGSRVTISLPLG